MGNLEYELKKVLNIASSFYENGSDDFHSPFFFLRKQGEITCVPVKADIEPALLEIRAKDFSSELAFDQYLDLLILDATKRHAKKHGEHQLAGVGYVFPYVGDFPTSKWEAMIANHLRRSGAKSTTCAGDGVVFVVDTPSGRQTWARFRENRGAALGVPVQIFVDFEIDRLYPYEPRVMAKPVHE
jgi:hypothetical protein